MMEWEFEIWQGGVMVACGSGLDEQTVRRESAHYAWQYCQDGPVEVKFGRSPLTAPPGLE